MDAAQSAIQSLEDDDSGALRLLAKAQDALQDQTDVEPEFTALVDVLASSLAQAGDVAHSLNAYLGRTELDPARLQTLDDRMSLWMSLARRFKRTPQELPALYLEWKTRLTQLDAATDLEALEATEVKAAVTGNGRADKAQVTAMITRLLGLRIAPSPADAADAVAIAICHIWRAPAQARIAAAVAVAR